MGFSISSRSPCQFKSVSLRSNEEFVRLYNDAMEARRNLLFQRSRVIANDYIYSLNPACFRDSRWQRLQKEIWCRDRLMKRAEKNAHLSEVLSGIMLQFERSFFPALREVRSCLEKDRPFFVFIRTRGYPKPEFILEMIFELFADNVSSGLESAHKVVVSALALLSFVYRYLVGCVDKGGSKTYSPGSFLFRLIFVAIVLFLGSYVWIKFRQACFTANRRKRKFPSQLGNESDRASQLGNESDVPGGVYRRAVKDSRGSVTHYRYEPRFKPLREKPESGTPVKFNCLSLGSYDTPREAEIVRHIAVVLYGEEEGRPVQFEDGLCLPFPSVTERENCPPSGKEKAAWVTHKTKDLYAELLREKARRLQQLHPAFETGSHRGHGGDARRSDLTPSTSGAHSTAIKRMCSSSPHGGNSVEEQATNSEFHRSGHESPRAREVFSAYCSDSDFVQFISNMLQPEENDFPAMVDLDRAEADSETDRVVGYESTSVPPQSSALDNPTSAIVASLPQLRVGDQSFEIIEARLNSTIAIPLQHLKSLTEQFQLGQCVTCQETGREEFSGSNFELQQKLLESEARNSELQQKLRQSEVEKEKSRSMCRQLRSMVRRLANLISASDEDESPVDIQ